MSDINYPPSSMLGTNRLLWQLTGANMNVTTDQVLMQMFPFTKFIIDRIMVTNASGAIITAAGGFYSGAGKTGTTVVAAAQTWAGLTSSVKVVIPTLTVTGQELLTASSLFFALTTPMGSAGTVDIYCMGVAS